MRVIECSDILYTSGGAGGGGGDVRGFQNKSPSVAASDSDTCMPGASTLPPDIGINGTHGMPHAMTCNHQITALSLSL